MCRICEIYGQTTAAALRAYDRLALAMVDEDIDAAMCADADAQAIRGELEVAPAPEPNTVAGRMLAWAGQAPPLPNGELWLLQEGDTRVLCVQAPELDRIPYAYTVPS